MNRDNKQRRAPFLGLPVFEFFYLLMFLGAVISYFQGFIRSFVRSYW